MGLLDIFFPKWCVGCKKLGTYICPNCFAKLSFDPPLICAVCNRQAVDGRTHPYCRRRYTIDGIFAALVYAGIVKKLVSTFKFKPYLTDLSETLLDLFYESLIQKEAFMTQFSKDVVCIPIPLHPIKLRKRGYNQAAILAKGLSKRFNVPYSEVLTRLRQTATQVGLTREKRRENLAGAFGIVEKNWYLQEGKVVFLVDDIITSGATFLEAAKTLKKQGVGKVYGLALTHGQ